MPYRINWEKNGIHVQFYGVFNLQEAVEATDKTYGDNRVDNIDYAIWDLSDIDRQTMHENEVKVPMAIHRAASFYMNRIKMAMIAKDEQSARLGNIMIDLSRQLGTPWEYKIFTDLEEARRWISSFETL